MNPTQDHIQKIKDIKQSIINATNLLHTLGMSNADTSHAIIKLGSAERGLDDFLAKANGSYPYKFSW